MIFRWGRGEGQLGVRRGRVGSRICDVLTVTVLGAVLDDTLQIRDGQDNSSYARLR
jgi:hypothetical protein